jgi:hypothetical protein
VRPDALHHAHISAMHCGFGKAVGASGVRIDALHHARIKAWLTDD